MEESSLYTLQERVDNYLSVEIVNAVITYIEDELEDIIDRIFAESDVDKDKKMEGNAKILHKVKRGFLILTDEGEKAIMPEDSYKGTTVDSGTRIMCGKFRTSKGRFICIDAQECLSMNELKYQMFCFIDDWDMTNAASAAWAIYKDASPQNQEAMKFCIHRLRDFLKKQGKNRAGSDD